MANSDFTLDDIRKHPDFPFHSWRTDDLPFLMLELYWAERARIALGAQMRSYAPLFDTERDGNPILTLTDITTMRGLRLVVLENEEGKPSYPQATGLDAFFGMYAFLNTGHLLNGETEINELVLLVSMDAEYDPYIDMLIRRHCCDGASPEEMEALLATYEADFGMTDPPDDLSEH